MGALFFLNSRNVLNTYCYVRNWGGFKTQGPDWHRRVGEIRYSHRWQQCCLIQQKEKGKCNPYHCYQREGQRESDWAALLIAMSFKWSYVLFLFLSVGHMPEKKNLLSCLVNASSKQIGLSFVHSPVGQIRDAKGYNSKCENWCLKLIYRLCRQWKTTRDSSSSQKLFSVI